MNLSENQFPCLLSDCFLTKVLFIFAQFFNVCGRFFLISVEKHLTWPYWLKTVLNLSPVVVFFFFSGSGKSFKTGRMPRLSELPAKLHQFHQQRGIFFIQKNIKIKNYLCAIAQYLQHTVYKGFWKAGCYEIHLNDFTCLHKRMNSACTSLKAVSPRQEKSFSPSVIIFCLIVIYYQLSICPVF